MTSSLFKYLEYLRVSFQSILAYRARYYVGIFTYLIHVSVYYFIYKALFSGQESIHGYSLTMMVTYVALGWVAKSFYLNYIDMEMAEDVRMGQIAMDLIKPVDYQLMYFFRGYGQSLFRMALFTPPIVLVTAIIFPILPPSSITALFLFFFSTLAVQS